ncbi:hypothetical protein J6590_093727, partial [Homalodisca vitripennis]
MASRDEVFLRSSELSAWDLRELFIRVSFNPVRRGDRWLDVNRRPVIVRYFWIIKVLMQQQQAAIDETIAKTQKENMNAEAAECHLNFAELDAVLQPIIDSCTKDSISSGKAWILQRATHKKVDNLIASYLLSKVLEERRTFNHKLHIIYLVNDILHH